METNRKGLKKEDGYTYGLTAGLNLLRAAKRHGIRELTYYGFTVDNCKRPKEQVEAFSLVCVKATEMILSEGVLLNVIENSKSPCFPPELLRYTEVKACDEEKVRVNLLVNYGWGWDMKNGFPSRNIPRIDLVIRWGGMSCGPTMKIVNLKGRLNGIVAKMLLWVVRNSTVLEYLPVSCPLGQSKAPTLVGDIFYL